MRKLSLTEYLQTKHHYRNFYRRLLRWNQWAMCLMILQMLIIIYLYASQNEPDYYATNSASSIKLLNPLSQPNHSSQALLAPDFPEELGEKTLSI